MWDPLWDTVLRELLSRDDSTPLETKYPNALLIHLWQSAGTNAFDKLETEKDSWLNETSYGRSAQRYITFTQQSGYQPNFSTFS